MAAIITAASNVSTAGKLPRQDLVYLSHRFTQTIRHSSSSPLFYYNHFWSKISITKQTPSTE
ncbi:hypothetical protein Hanom_Chr05g00402241 [Helianthus anomalus]